MAYKKVRTGQYMADTIEDLKKIPETEMGAECIVIKEACEYKLMSTGEWIKQTASAAASAPGSVMSEVSSLTWSDMTGHNE